MMCIEHSLNNKFVWRLPCKYVLKQHLWPSQTFNFSNIKNHVIVTDTWVQELHDSVSVHSKLQVYNEVNSVLEPAKYLSCVTHRQHRMAFIRLRLSSHNLEIDTGRQKFILRENRYCSHCKSASNIAIVEDYIYFLYHGKLYDDIRKSCDLIDIWNTEKSLVWHIQHGNVSIFAETV
jgi:hypothetical protein